MFWLRLAYTSVVLSWKSITARPLRAFLTALGILVGVASVTVVVALGEGASAAISGRIDSLGSNALSIRPRPTARSGASTEARIPLLTEGDADAIRRNVKTVTAVAPLLLGVQQVVWRTENASTSIIGTNLDFFVAKAWRPVRGELWTETAATTGDKVCVIGQTVADEVFGDMDPVGQVLRVGKHPFRVIGLLEKKGSTPFGGDQDDTVLMPLKTMRGKLAPTRPGQVHQIVISARDKDVVAYSRAAMQTLLRQQHGLYEGVEDDFEIRSQDQFREAQDRILGVLQNLLLCVAGVSLLVGGIGVMNIMLVSVAERTREIGIRMAIGARQYDIMAQFLIEAAMLCALGGLGGVVVAVVLVHAAASALSMPMEVSPIALGVALATSSSVGILFGFMPARRAAALDPIEALGRE